jgi:hypothetical protein
MHFCHGTGVGFCKLTDDGSRPLECGGMSGHNLDKTPLDKTLLEMRTYIRDKVAAGFYSTAEIAEWAVEVYETDAPPDVLRPHAEQFVREEDDRHREASGAWPDETDCDHLDVAFADLNRAGIVGRQNFSCCGNCGVHEIGTEMAAEHQQGQTVRGYAFYHVQDTDGAVEGRGLYLFYGSSEEGEAAALRIGHEIVAALRRHGLNASWNGQWNKRIHVPMDWKRRRRYEGPN